jgi:hypothetical protein
VERRPGLAILPYEVVRSSSAPRSMVVDFLTSTYEAGARTAGWDVAAFATRAAHAHRSHSRSRRT